MLDVFFQYGNALLGWVAVLALVIQQAFDHFKVMFLEPFMERQHMAGEQRVRFLWVIRALVVIAAYYLVWGGNTQTIAQLPFMAIFAPFAADAVVIILVIGGTELIHHLIGALAELKNFFASLQLPPPPQTTAQRASRSPAPTPQHERNPSF